MQTAVQGPARASTPAPDRPSTPASVLLGGQGSPELTRPQQITIAQGAQTITIPTPRTAADIDALKARREELSNQLQSVDSRRSKLINQMKQTGDATATQGLEARLALLDARQLQLETDIAQTGQQLTSPAAGMIVSTGTPPIFAGLKSNQVMTLSVLSVFLVFFPLAFSVARAVWKKSSRPGPAPGVFTETAQRLERLEASVDAIAIEIERVSEGQRFVTKLLSESQPALQLGAGQRTPETIRGS
jgi:hypothetical protein